MADEGPSAEEPQVKFTVKTSKDAKYELNLPLNMTIADVKQKLSTAEYADIPTDRIRLIYSGRVLKDPDTIGSIKIKDGHTVHLVQGAASNARQNPATQSSSAPASTAAAAGNSQPSGATQVPTNLATGTGNNPLAGITGARYAGFHGLPGMDMFGPDGGVSCYFIRSNTIRC
jgi:ubiquilin